MTTDMRKLKHENVIREFLTKSLEAWSSLLDLDAIYVESSENLTAIAEKAGPNTLIAHNALRIKNQIEKSQKRYDTYFAKGRIDPREESRLMKQFRYDLSKYFIFMSNNGDEIKKIHPNIEKNYTGNIEQKLMGAEENSGFFVDEFK